VKGVHLRAVLEEIREGRADVAARYSLGNLLTVFLKLCDAVAYAHSKNIIHRDLKPDNIMLGDYGEVVLMDWGLAKQLDSAEDLHLNGVAAATSPALTLDGTVMGTPHFMSPEQAAGRISELDQRTDVFALGGILYNILTLHPPFPGVTTEEVMQKVRSGFIPPPTTFNPAEDDGEAAPAWPALLHCPGRRVPETLAAIAMKALARDPARRYQSVTDLENDIKAYQGGFATSFEKSARRLFVLALRRRKTEFLFAGLAATILLAVGTVSVVRIVASEKRAQAALAELRSAAPTFAAEAQSLLEQFRFEEALARVEYAISLDDGKAEYHLLRGHILQTLLRMPEAVRAYSRALNLPAARENVELCNRFMEENRGRTDWLPASLSTLHAALLRQQRSAEALAIMRQFGPDKGLLYDSWKAILAKAGLPVGPRNLHLDLRGRFTINLQGANVDNLAPLKEMPVERLNLAGTKVSDLTPLLGMLLTDLDLTGTKVSDLAPLACMPLQNLVLRDTKIEDLTPLADVPLQSLSLENAPVSNLEPLRNSSLRALNLRGSLVENLGPLHQVPLEELILENTGITDLGALRQLPLRRLSLVGCEKIKDWKALASLQRLEAIAVPAEIENHPILKKMPNLKAITSKPVRSGWPSPKPAPMPAKSK
jgi:tetratricopeptide (TPR) repeat protein